MGTLFDLTGKVAVVTGSTSGIGIGIARVLSRAGAHVVVTGRRAERGEAVAAELAAAGGRASFHRLDIMDEASIVALVEDTVADLGSIDVLVNNAANVNAKDGDVADLTAAEWDEMLASDLRSVFLVSKHATAAAPSSTSARRPASPATWAGAPTARPRPAWPT